MDKEKIQDYIERLQEFEKDIKDDEYDEDFIKDLDSLLKTLSDDIQSSYGPTSLEIPIKFKKLKETAETPTYSKEGDAGMDLTITSIIDHTDSLITYGFGIAIEIPKGYVGLIFPRSSIRKYDLSLSNAVGVIDSGYRGEIQATFKRLHGSIQYSIGDRGAQIIIIPYPQVKFIESVELSSTERGVGGFGSSGK